MAALKDINPTPFVIHSGDAGTRDALKAFVSKAVQNGVDGKQSEDQKLINASKPAILDAIDLLPEDFTMGVVRADGRFTARGIVIHISIDGVKTI